MKKLWLIIIAFFYPIYQLKDCSVADKKEREKNYQHNQENRFLLFDCALHCGYFFCWCMGVIHLVEKNSAFIFPSLQTALCTVCGVIAAITFAMAFQQIIIFLFLSKEIE